MVDDTVDEFAKLREAKSRREGDQARVQAFLERPADHVFKVPGRIDDKVLEFRRWTHEQANLITGLPFYHKLHEKDAVKNLSPPEKTQFLALAVEMVELALVQPERWKAWLADAANLEKVEAVWWYMNAISGPPEDTLREFFESDRGQAYGAFWFLRMGKLPSEIAKLPDSDIKAVNVFLSVFAEKHPA